MVFICDQLHKALLILRILLYAVQQTSKVSLGCFYQIRRQGYVGGVSAISRPIPAYTFCILFCFYDIYILSTFFQKVFSEAEEMAKRYRQKMTVVPVTRKIEPLPDHVLHFEDEENSLANWTWFKFQKDNEPNP